MIIKHIRITNYNRLVDRFLTSQVKKSSDIKKMEMGKIYAVVEITNPWHPNAQIGQTIINSMTRAYYKSANTNELINFEVALKAANESLARIVQNGETDWMGKLNSILAIISGDKLHLAYTGKTKAYLVRAGKILPIISGQTTYPAEHPLKTFTNVISGKLEAGDKIILSSPLLLDYLKPQQLEIILGKNNLAEATLEIVQVLKSRRANHVGCIIIEAFDKIPNDLTAPEVVYLDQQSFDTAKLYAKKIWEHIESSLSILGDHTKKLGQGAKNTYREKILPRTKQIWQKSRQQTDDKQPFSIQNKRGPLFKTTKDKVPPTTDKKIIAKTKEALTENKNQLRVNYYQKASQKVSLGLTKFFYFLTPYAKKLKLGFSRLLLPRNRPKLYIGIVIILVAILVANISHLRSVNQQKEEAINYSEQLKELENKKDDARLAILANQDQKALGLLTEIQKSLEPMLANPEIADRAQTLANEIQQELDKLSKITRLNNTQKITDFISSDSFYIISKNIYAFNSSTNGILVSSININQSAKQVAKIPTSGGLAKTATVMGESFYIYTQQKKVYELKNDKLSEVKPDEGNWSNATAISSYLTNLYFLDGEQGQIYKYTPQADSFSAPVEYINSDKIDLKNSLDLAIDGSIYVLKKDGNIVKITLGKLQDFEVKDIPEPNSKISNPKQIFTNENMNSIYVLDSNRIVELDKSGNFTAQYAFPAEFSNIKYFSLDEKSKELLILNDNTVYKFGI